MQTFSVHEAKTHLSRLLAMVASGEEIVVTKSGKPVARLSPFVATEPSVAHDALYAVKTLGDVIGPFHDEWGA